MWKRHDRYVIPGLIALVCLLTDPVDSFALHAWDVPGREPSVVSLRGSYGALEGEAHEYVYDNSFFGGNEKVSELIWDLSGLQVAGAVLSIRPTGNLSVHAGGWTCVNKGNGVMVDYDWAFGGPAWSDRSISDVEVISSYMTDINVAYRFIHERGFSLSAVIGYKQDYWEWEDSVVEFVYSVYGFRDYYEAGDGSNMIDYDQLFQIPYVGLDSSLARGSFALNAYVLYSPLVVAEDNDYHIARDIHFKETFSGGIYLAGGVAAQYDITSALFVAVAADVQSIPEFTGDMELTDALGDTYRYSDSAGISHWSSMLSASIGLRF